MAAHCADGQQIHMWRHQHRVLGQSNLAQDGVHLNEHGLHAYRDSVVRALSRHGTVHNDVGENDLGTVGGNVSLITSHPRHFLAQLTPHTCVVFVSQLLLFPVYNNISETVLSVNNSLKCHCAQLQTVNRNGKRAIDKKHYCYFIGVRVYVYIPNLLWCFNYQKCRHGSRTCKGVSTFATCSQVGE